MNHYGRLSQLEQQIARRLKARINLLDFLLLTHKHGNIAPDINVEETNRQVKPIISASVCTFPTFVAAVCPHCVSLECAHVVDRVF